MNLTQALRLVDVYSLHIKSPVRLALVGSGGKTTALFQLAHQLQPPVVVTATTHLGVDQTGLADHHFRASDPAEARYAVESITEGVNLLTGRESEAGRVNGLSIEVMEALKQAADARHIPLLIEADGSRRRPLKAPADHEPAIPGFVNQVIVVAGLSGLGKLLNETYVHRPERFSAISGLSLGDPVTAEALTNVLSHPQGGLKGIPSGARRILLLNQADTHDLVEQGKKMAGRLVGIYSAVLVASLNPTLTKGDKNSWSEKVLFAYRPIAGILLAAGGSRRLGQPKQLLEWHGIPFVRRAALAGLQAGLSPMVVVIGAYAPEVRSVLEDLPVIFVNNPGWNEGQSTSLKAGLQQLPDETEAAIFLLSDQPQVSADLVRLLVDAYAASLAPVVAPQVAGRRGNPVLFDRVAFDDLSSLHGDTGGRAIFSKYPPLLVDWPDESLLMDVDTPEDYNLLLSRQK